MIKTINKKTLNKYLAITLDEIMSNKGISKNDKIIKFSITPNYEINKKHDAWDDIMRLSKLSEKQTIEKYFDFDEVISILASVPDARYPVWVHVSLEKLKDDEIIFNIKTSLRFRKTAHLAYHDTGHPPFKAILN